MPLPATVSSELGASLGVPAMTACHCLFADGPLRDATVLVVGGAGAVGHFAIELARWAGAWVVSTVSCGADPTLPVRACMTANLPLRSVLLYGVAAHEAVEFGARGKVLIDIG